MSRFVMFFAGATAFAVGNFFIAPSSGQEKKSTPPATSSSAKPAKTEIKPLNAEQQKKLLATRLKGGMESSFGQFANMFLVLSRIQLGQGIALMTSDREISQTELQSPFPDFYQPTLAEFLDAIALQTHSQWKYDPSDKYFKSEVKHDTPVEGLAIFEFTKTERKKPFDVTLAKGWKRLDKGNWLMLVPPTFPVGLDIYEMGTYSTDDKAKQADLLKKVQREVSLEWARRVSKDAAPEKLKTTKVGLYDALFFEAMIPSQLNKEIRWRQWVFMVDSKCYFVVSTILPELEEQIFPDVEKMLASFKVKK